MGREGDGSQTPLQHQAKGPGLFALPGGVTLGDPEEEVLLMGCT